MGYFLREKILKIFKTRLSVFVALIFIAGAVTPVNLYAVAPGCVEFRKGGGLFGYFFDTYESAEYINGFLVLHFKLHAPYADGRSWTLLPNVFNELCEDGSAFLTRKTVSLPPGVERYSIRFNSQTQYVLWDDESGTEISCPNCVDLPLFPEYYEVAFIGSVDGGADMFLSGSYRIKEDAREPPSYGAVFPTSEGCAPITASGYYFDAYERVQYMDGFLWYHFRLKSPYNTVRSWTSKVVLHNSACVAIEETPLTWGTQITDYTRYYSVRFSSPTHYDIWNDETNTKELCAACSVDIPARLQNGDPFFYVSFSGFIDGGASYIQSTPFPVQETAPRPDPVIIVPGILGSAQKNGVWVMDPILHVYDNLINTLKANGYIEGLDLFPFPYEWKMSNRITAEDLKTRINEIKEICHCDKVDIVGHSMGGLVARSYVQSDEYENDVDQLIFLGTPHNGAPKAYLMWEAGESDIKRDDLILKLKLTLDAKLLGYESLFDYIHSYPVSSLKELLPIFDYLEDSGTETVSTYPESYPQNVFLENLHNTLGVLKSRARVLNITGDNLGDNTIHSYSVSPSDELPLWEHGKPEGFSLGNILFGDIPGIMRGAGDGTVPEEGSILSDVNALKVSSDHTFLPTEAEEEVFKELTGSDPSTVFKESFTPFGILYIQLLSPVDFQVIAPDGKKVGKDFVSGGEFSEIEGGFYSGFLTHDEYVTIPNPLEGEYRLVLEGVEEGGGYTVVSSLVQSTSTEAVFFEATTTPGLVTELNVVLGPEESGDMEIIPEDSVPPVIEIATPEGVDYLRSSSTMISILTTDAESGISTERITLDGIMKENGDELDFFFGALGDHRLDVEATDNVGNVATSSVLFQVIATLESTKVDIERAFTLGWIFNKKTKDQFVKKLEKAVKIERMVEILEEKLPGEAKVMRRIERLEKRLDKILGRQFLKELEHERGKTINEQAYQLLKEDVEWMLNN